MDVSITLTDEEVRDAIREWMQSKGIPVIAVEKLVVQVRQSGTGWGNAETLRVMVAFGCEAYSSQDVRPLDTPVMVSVNGPQRRL